MNVILVTKSVNRQLGRIGIEANRSMWHKAKAVIDKSSCQCENPCDCSECNKYGCDKCFSTIVRYLVNITLKELNNG